MLEDDGKEVIADLIECCELLGVMPRQAASLLMPLIDKPKGGLRNITVFSAFYRLWERVRRPCAEEWLQANQRPWNACGAGRSPEDVVWRQACRAEAAVGEGGHSAGGLWDLRKYYETIQLDTLESRARARGVCPILTTLAINTYRGPRLLRLRSQTSSLPLFARRGLRAGSVFADLFTLANSLLEFDAFVLRNPEVNLAVYIDDIACAAEDASRKRLVRNLARAAADLADTVHNEIGCEIATDKTATQASCPALLREVCAALGPMASMKPGAASNLGIDSCSARPRRQHGHASVRRRRAANAVARVTRIRRIARTLPRGRHRMSRIVTAGVRPALAYGTRVNGASNTELLRYRRLLMSMHAPSTQGASLTAKCILSGDASWAIAAAPILAWIHEVWRAGTASEAPHLSFPELRAMWDAAVPMASTTWGGSRGPITNALLSLQRIGWSWPTPFTLADAQGNVEPIAAISPRLWSTRIRDAVQDMHERKLGTLFAAHDPAFGGRRAYLGTAAFLATSRRIPAASRSVIRRAAAGCLWTPAVAHRAGYVIEPTCALCGIAEDTPHHRACVCTAAEVVEARRKAVPLWFTREAAVSSADDPLFSRLAVPHPADMWPRPLDDPVVEVLDGDGQAICGDDALDVSGHLFLDGSCAPHVVRGLARAAWALVMVSRIGKVIKVIRGAVTKDLPQTPQAAEFLPAVVAASHAVGPSVIYDDCSAVVNACADTRRVQLQPCRMYAGLIRAMRAAQGFHHIGNVLKVKAHRDFDTDRLDDEDQWTAWGNDRADWHAKAALAAHPAPSAEQRLEVDMHLKRARLAARLYTSVWHLWPPMARSLERAPRAARERRRAVIATTHCWRPHPGGERCTACMRRAVDGATTAERERIPCTGAPPVLLRLRELQLGHKLVFLALHDDDDGMVVCAVCGGAGSRKPQVLGSPCTGVASEWGKRSLSRVLRGAHPQDRSRPLCCPSTVASAIAAAQARATAFREAGADAAGGSADLAAVTAPAAAATTASRSEALRERVRARAARDAASAGGSTRP